MVEQASAAAGSMNDQAARLTELTAFFRLAETSDGGAPAALADPRLAGGQRRADMGRPRGAGAPPRRRGAGHAARAARHAELRPAPGPGPLAPSQELLGAASGADWEEF
jgi:hypothetical protein